MAEEEQKYREGLDAFRNAVEDLGPEYAAAFTKLTEEQRRTGVRKKYETDALRKFVDACLPSTSQVTATEDVLAKKKDLFTKELDKVWSSVLKLRPADGGSGVEADASTALVYDIFLEQEKKDADPSGFMLLLANAISKLTTGEVYELLYSDQEDYYEMLTFKMHPSLFYLKPNTKNDVQILKIKFDDAIWDVYPGQATRKAPEPRTRPKRKASDRKLANILCKTLRLNYSRTEGQEVRVFGYPSTTTNRFMATSFITSIEKETFHLQNLSGPGLSGGAVITSGDGLCLIGYMGAADGSPFGSYAYDVRALPARPSSRRVSEKDGE